MELDAPMTQIGGDENRFHVLSCIVRSNLNRHQALSGVDKVTFKNGFNGNQNVGY